MLSPRLAAAGHPFVAIGHRDAMRFDFADADCVWVLSYSRTVAENQQLLQRIATAGVARIVYVSSSSTIVAEVTRCYEYPRVKYLAERDALRLPMGKVLTIGLMYEQPSELPGGVTIATSYDELARFFAAPQWPEESNHKRLFSLVERPFRNGLDHFAFALYGRLMKLAGTLPCLLRPLDLVLRSVGVRWHGYVYLSNKLWISTIS